MWVVVAKLEEAFDPPARVFRTLTIVTVGQVYDQASALEPLAFTSGNELINDTLSVVSEVTELSFPDSEGVRRHEGVAEFETECTILGKVRVADNKAGLVRAEIVERNVLLFIDLVMDNGMALREGTTFDILTRQADMDFF